MIENVRREDLNPVEEAFGYNALIERFGLTQDEVAKQVGKSRPAVANILRLLDLPDEVLEHLRNGDLTAGHARALLGLADESKIVPLADKIVARALSVRETEATVKRMNEAPEETPEQSGTISREERAFYKKMEKMAALALARSVRITRTEKKKVLEVPYETAEDLTELLKRLCGEDSLKQAESSVATRNNKKETKGM
jgi:ParB family chromosome partitioning protein